MTNDHKHCFLKSLIGLKNDWRSHYVSEKVTQKEVNHAKKKDENHSDRISYMSETLYVLDMVVTQIFLVERTQIFVSIDKNQNNHVIKITYLVISNKHLGTYS